MKIFLSICLATILGTSAWADSICRQPEAAEFGSAVTSQTNNSFVITQNCAEDRLLVEKPVSLSVFIGHGVGSAEATRTASTNSVWTVLFDLDRADPKDSGQQLMNQIPSGLRVKVTGYTCSIGSEGYNEKLSRQRAETVADFLRNRGVVIDSIEGKGECCPVSVTNLSQNRRVLIEEEK